MSRALDRSTFRALQEQLAPRPHAFPTCLVLAADLTLAGFAAWLACRPDLVARCAASLVLAFVLVHFYLIHHECTHRSVFARDLHNVALGELLGLVLAYPFGARRRSHMLHHVWAGHLERDPANARARARLSRLRPAQLRVIELLWRSWFPFLAINDRIGLWRSALSARDGARHARRERWSARLALLLYLLALAVSAYSVTARAVLVSYAIAFVLLLICEELINLPHHIEAPTVERKLPLWEQGEVSHSCRHVPLWSSLVLLHFNLHTAHHLFPGLPWFRLPQAERALRVRLACPTVEAEFAHAMRLRRARFSDVFAHYMR